MKIVNGFGMLKVLSTVQFSKSATKNSFFFKVENFSTSSCNRKNWNNDYNVVSNSH